MICAWFQPSHLPFLISLFFCPKTFIFDLLFSKIIMESSSLPPLHDIRVLDLSRVLAGPYCGYLLSLLGAEVIKIEDATGDESRAWPPVNRPVSTPFLALNMNKKGMVVNLKSPEGQAIIRDMVKVSDVLVENFKTGTMEKFGLSHAELKEINPELVFVSVSAFGREGPRAQDFGYEALMQAYSGVMSMTGEPGSAPVRSGVSFLDMTTGLISALATILALYQRERDGGGSHVQSSLLQTAMGLMSQQVANFTLDGVLSGKMGSAHPQIVPYQAYPTADGDIFIASANQNLFEKFCDALERNDLAQDPRFADNPARVLNREALIAALKSEVEKYTTVELLDHLKERGVPATAVNNVEEMMADGQAEAIGAFVKLVDPQMGEMQFSGLPFSLGNIKPSVVRRAPLLGEHSQEILESLGYDSAKIEDLVAKGVVNKS